MFELSILVPLKLAYFSPLPPQRSGIADYSADLLPYLNTIAHVSLFVDDERCHSNSLGRMAPMYAMHEFAARRSDFDLAIYHMGNSTFHETIYAQLRRFPCVTVLHDYGLHHFIASRTAGQNNFASYMREMGYTAGRAGTTLARSIQAGWRAHPVYDIALNKRVLDSSLGVMVHSDYVASQIRRDHPSLEVKLIQQPIPLPKPDVTARQRLGIPSDAFVIGCAGQVTSEKRIDLVLRAFAQVQERLPDARFVMVGEIPLTHQMLIEQTVQTLSLQDAVKCTGFVDGLQQFYSYIDTMDVCVNLRFPTLGETSAGLLRVMAAGRAAIVSNAGWYAELPNESCIKFTHGDDDEATLAQHLINLARDATRRTAIGQAARAYVAAECAPERSARAYVDFAKHILRKLMSW